jgi:dihydrofolate reductase
MPRIRAIAAVARNGVIGDGPRIPWHLPEDFRWFKQVTMGGILVMGRRTFESIGRPLPGRETVVLSRTGFARGGVRIFADTSSLLAALATERRWIWVCGGAQIYRELLPACSDLFLTRVAREAVGDAHFPPVADLFRPLSMVLSTEQFAVEHLVSRG